ncbi:RsmD family RNA methyltransferase [Bacteroidetes bacterium endosymbiont of Geopemphigus sp.]|uniref:RsmD family RNA methyltransferase n=1 Tax=Bacteroidetes bacterium endosymbiont of Geopemphigus sp. TaxID=2047937 RepID=UPI000CD0E682|nr:RsmD family RNA methyltransferase [Bacteroidetes bacterium endosymbiont of Geopemphigus sp.]
MRIISGKLKGRKLTPPKNLSLRPTTDRAKEGLFNILSHKRNLENLIILDLFCGTGNITCEFASRGVLEVQAVDSHFHCVQYIQSTLEKFQLTEQCKVFQEDVFVFLSRMPLKPYDLVFSDPPYDLSAEKLQYLIKTLLHKDWIKETGCLILEHSGRWKVPDVPFYTSYTKKYGGVHLSFFEKE